MNDIRQKFWTEVYLAYVRGSEQPFAALAALRADEALAQFDARFKRAEIPVVDMREALQTLDKVISDP